MFDLATARARIAIAPAVAPDSLVKAAINLCISLAEKYCDRGLVRKQQNDRFVHVSSQTISLYRYPIVDGASTVFIGGTPDSPSITWVISGTPLTPSAGLVSQSLTGSVPLNVDGTKVGYHIDLETGEVVFDCCVVAHVLNISYTGGYDPLPDDIEFALWQIFDSVWPSFQGQSISSGAEIESVTLADVGTVRFKTSGGSGGSSFSGGVIPFSAMTILDFYRRRLC